MVQHTWLYQSLLHDLFGFRLNRVSIPVEESSSSGNTNGVDTVKTKTYDLDAGDAFWGEHAGVAFPAVASAIHDALQTYNKKMQAIQGGGGGGVNNHMEEDLTAGLATAINALPEMTEMKRSVDMHTNIATALVNEIKERELDKYVELEDDIPSSSTTSALQQLEAMLKPSARGTAIDKTRALLVAVLLKKNLTEPQLQQLVTQLQACGGSTAALTYLKQLASIKSMQMEVKSSPDQFTTGVGGSGLTGAAAKQAVSALGGLAAKVTDHSRGVLKGVKAFLPHKKDIPITRLVDDIMEQKQTSHEVNKYLYLDPKAPRLASGEAPRVRAPFRNAIVFAVGGGNFVEAHALQELAQKNNKVIIYGSTGFVAPTEFVEELEQLGAGG